MLVSLPRKSLQILIVCLKEYHRTSIHPVLSPALHLSLQVDTAKQLLRACVAPRPKVRRGAVRRPAASALQQIQRPPRHQVRSDRGGGPQAAGLQGGARAQGHGGVFRAHQRRHVGFALSYMIGFQVVHRVAALPRKIRHQQQRVKSKAHGGLQPLVPGKRAVASLVR